VFTALYALSPCIKQIRLLFKGLKSTERIKNLTSSRFINWRYVIPCEKYVVIQRNNVLSLISGNTSHFARLHLRAEFTNIYLMSFNRLQIKISSLTPGNRRILWKVSLIGMFSHPINKVEDSSKDRRNGGTQGTV
jgi:hypothetical protein